MLDWPPFRSPTIRSFAYLLLVLLLALAAGTALYAGMVGLRQRVPDRPFDPVAEVTIPPQPAPERLPQGAPPERTAIEASQSPGRQGAVESSAARSRPEILVVEFEVVGASLLGDEAGCASYLAHDGSDYRWTPLQNCERTDDRFRLSVPVIAAGDRIVALAQRESHALHAPLARTTIQAELVGAATPPRLSVILAEVELQLPENVASAGPLQLRRGDDPSWLPMGEASSGVFLRRGTVTKVLLGAGRYELGAPLSTTSPFVFEVPAAGSVTIPIELAAVRAGRP